MGRIISTVTCYKNDEEVIEFGRQLSTQAFSEKIVYIITANCVKDIEKLEREISKLGLEAYVYEAPKNLGYINGCLYGIGRYSSLRDDDIVIISNTDLAIPDGEAFIKIAKEMKNDNIWCLGPSIRLPSGSYQNPFLKERPTRKKMRLWKIIQGNPVLLKLYDACSRIKHDSFSIPTKEETRDVYALHGSFFALNSLCVQQLQQVKNEIFMYGEEIFVAEIVRHNKGIARYIDSIDVIHNENSTTGITNIKIKAGWYKQSFGYLYKTYFS